MLNYERHRKIVELVNEHRSFRVTDLSRLLGVTEETIRRDLEKLQAEGRLVRAHGGAVSVEEGEKELPYARREVQRVVEKSAIAETVLPTIREDDTLMLDSSSTVWQLARQLPDIPLTVVTNSLKVALELSGREHVRVISTGGTLSPQALCFLGPLAEKSLEGIRAGKFFFSCKGFSADVGASESDELQALLKKKMADCSSERVLLIDSSKLSRNSLNVWAQPGEITRLVTDDDASPETMDALRKAGVEVRAIKAPSR